MQIYEDTLLEQERVPIILFLLPLLQNWNVKS